MVNPKKVAKATPKEQFDAAKHLYDIKSYDQAKREFRKLLKAFLICGSGGKPVFLRAYRRIQG